MQVTPAGRTLTETAPDSADGEGAPAIDPEVAAALGQFYDRYDEITAGMFDDDPDLRIER